jgi:simple sugar transport system ATP-binding protein
VSTLSGGNQQRVVLSKCLSTGPKLLIMNSPTVGVDVGAKETLHLTIRRLADDGMGVLIVSDDLGELVENCDRVLVFRRGAVVDELSGARLTEDALAAELAVRH